jgi:hypothetical protein
VERPIEPFVDALLAAPVGVALLAVLEMGPQAWDRSRQIPASPADAAAVERAARELADWELGRLVALVLDVAQHAAGPWMPHAPDALAHAYRHAAARRPLAEAIADRFGPALHRELDRDAQEWWTTDPATWRSPAMPRFTDFLLVYGNGEFTFDGLWTVTDPPAEAHADLLMQWEMDHGSPATRWHLPVEPAARIYEIHRPDDWVRLVDTYPKQAPGRSHSGWELPGPNQHQPDIARLLAVPGQRAARTTAPVHVLPDWAAVARDHDGVHLSWAGFLTTEGFVADAAGGAVTMLRYWASERTLWLADVFGAPAPSSAPTVVGGIPSLDGLDRAALDDRRDRDLEHLLALLGR